MKITIETDGADTAPATTMAASHETTVSAAAGDTDGGAGPSGSGSTGGGTASGDDADGGAPPQSLLDTIAAAEAAEQHTPGQSNASGETDAGAGPASA